MAKRIRVYELARELGLDNKGALDLCIALGIEVKSHSSSIEDAQADRVRRKAEREGLVRPMEPEEVISGSDKGAEKPAAKSPSFVTEVPQGDNAVPVSEKAHTDKAINKNVEVSFAPEADVAIVADPGLSPFDKNPAVSASEHTKVIRSRPASELIEHTRSTQTHPRQRDPEKKTVRPHNNEGTKPERTHSGDARPSRGNNPADPKQVLSFSGKPIPPPPGASMKSFSGKPIPPPPGMGGRTRPPKSQAPGSSPSPSSSQGPRFANSANKTADSRQSSPPYRGSGSPSTQRRSPGQGSSFTSGRSSAGNFSGPRSSSPGTGPRSSSPGTGPRSSSPGTGQIPTPPPSRGGPASRGRAMPQKKTQRRKRVTEELEPIQVTAYAPSAAPIPEGEIIIERGSTPQEVGPKLNRSAGDVIRFLFLQGEVVTATQSLTDEMIDLFALELGAKVTLVDPGEEQEAMLTAKFFAEEDEEVVVQVARPPVVTVMGHVDHGKTLLLDRIRNANVVQGEAGGITQHIGAYQVEKNGHLITFIDTPGHEAFTQMRARGAKVTDIVILVVAANDGVMPQTIEAINHAKAAEVPIIVAVNKIDRPDADPTKVMQQLSEHSLLPESWGGDTITVEISALQTLGIDDLLEQVLVLSEVLELKAPYEGRARATVLESNLDIGRGAVATAVIQRGTLRVGDPIVAGAAWGKVKALINDKGIQIKEALPSTPVQILGLSEPPIAGDEVRVTSDATTARTIGEQREQRARLAGHTQGIVTGSGAKLEDIFEQIQRGETATLTLVLKTDVQGSLEAITESLRKLENDDVKIVFVQRGVGGITENDVQLAIASKATIIGFNVRPSRQARELAELQHVEIRTYEIIYKLIEEIQAAMIGMLAPVYQEVVTGDAEVREIFRVPKVGAIAGCYVQNGVITRGSKVRFLRDGTIIWKGTITSLKRFKEDAREVQSGFECGIGLSDFSDLKSGDVIETYEEREIERSL
ncbi:MAG: translation initiation factor IF-2 [Firmicutes bacterium]|nr:translation initiation factor IF-2 [Bacillota bacterium]